jgi:hypothetical protein
MKEIFPLKLKTGRQIDFQIRSFHYLNFDLRKTFDSEYPTIVALYKWDSAYRIKFRRVNVKLIDNPKMFFNTEPISDELKEIVIVLLFNEPLPSPRETALEYLDRFQHEIIDSLPIFLQFGFE